MNHAEISVIVPVFNGAEYLAEAVESILAQQCRPSEIIVVDDGSVDSTPALVAGFGEQVVSIRQDNKGPAAARNAGVARASAPLIAFLDADDLWMPACLARQLESISSEPGVDMAWGLSDRMFMPDAAPTREEWYGRPQWALAVSAMLFRRTAFDAIDGFDETLRAGEDMDLLVRLRERKAAIVRHANVVHIWRVHGGFHGADEAAKIQAHYRVVGKALARRRVRVDAAKADSE